jgi:TRAP-type C4-dicarboxylate transport system permease small subunit
MQKLLKLHNSLANILGLLIILIALIIVVEVSSRCLFNKPLPGPMEGTRVILAWVLFLSLAYGLVQRVHIKVQLFLDHYPRRVRSVMDNLIDVVTLCLFGILTYSAWQQFWESFTMSETMAAPIWIPFWLAKLALPIGSLIFVIQLVINLGFRFKGESKKEEA